MPHRLVTISMSNDDFRLAACTIDIIFWQTDNPETDYVKIVRYKNNDVVFTKENYNQIQNIAASAKERIDLIANFIKNKINNPLQRMLFE